MNKYLISILIWFIIPVISNIPDCIPIPTHHSQNSTMAVQSFRQIVGASPSTASPSNSTLIIIDAQNEYAEGKLKVTNADSSRKAIASLLQKYRSAGGRVVHVVHQTPNGAPVFTPDSKLAQEFEELAPKDGEKVIGKNHPSSFAETDLQEYLGSEAGSKIVLTGYMVSFGGLG